MAAPITADGCPLCQAELATVVIVTEHGRVRVGPRCARFYETFARLFGLQTRRRPALKRVK